MQRLVRAYFDKMKLWTAQLFVELKEEKEKFIKFIKSIVGENRVKFNWLLKEVTDLEDEYLKKVAKNYVQYVKDIHVLKTYHYNVEQLSSKITPDIIEGARGNIQRTQRISFDQYHSEMEKYPSKIENTALLKR